MLNFLCTTPLGLPNLYPIILQDSSGLHWHVFTVKPVLSKQLKNRQNKHLNDKWQLNEG